MQCTLCGATGTQFLKARHTRLGIVYLSTSCTKMERERLHPVRGEGHVHAGDL